MIERRRHMGGKAAPPEYLRFTALEDGVFKLTLPSDVTTSYVSWIEYSIDDGVTWIRTNNTSNTVTITTPTITAGNSVLWRGSGTRLGYTGGTASYFYTTRNSKFSATCQFDISGHLHSLLYYDSFWNTTTINTHCYTGLFYECTKLVNAEKLKFVRATNNYCYQYMFWGCTSLTTAPKVLPAAILAQGCYQRLFYLCSSLTTAPILSATTLATYCYAEMFQSCSALPIAPALPATTLAERCYMSMFAGCSSLLVAPQLPATTLQQYCYTAMFNGCASLTSAPDLPATTLVSNCYRYMFNGCTHITYIKAMFTTTPSSTYTMNWVANVASTGTFIKNSAAQWSESGANGIPTGWTVQTASS